MARRSAINRLSNFVRSTYAIRNREVDSLHQSWLLEVFHSLRERQPLRAPSQSNTSLEQSLIALECKKRLAFTCKHVAPSLQHSAALRAAGSSLLTRAVVEVPGIAFQSKNSSDIEILALHPTTHPTAHATSPTEHPNQHAADERSDDRPETPKHQQTRTRRHHRTNHTPAHPQHQTPPSWPEHLHDETTLETTTLQSTDTQKANDRPAQAQQHTPNPHTRQEPHQHRAQTCPTQSEHANTKPEYHQTMNSRQSSHNMPTGTI